MIEYRQGEVGLVSVNRIPEKLEKKNMILAYGEVTGHKHQVRGQVQVLTDGSIQYVVVSGVAELTHEEHGTIQLPKGKFEVRIQREYDILNDAVREVTD